MVRDESAAGIHIARDGGSGRIHTPDKSKQRLAELGQVAGVREPIVHLDVYIYRINRLPRRRERVAPDSLQIRGFAARAAARDEQIAAVVEVKPDHARVRVRRGLVIFEPDVGRDAACIRHVERQLHAVVQPAVVGDVLVSQ